MVNIEIMEYVDSPQARCDGGKGHTGHPAIYLDLSSDKVMTCPYCSKKFKLKKAK